MSGCVLVAACPAKVNLSLRVLGRRADGYHELRTVFQAIDLCDELEAENAPDLTLTCEGRDVPTDDSNLVLRAARLLREREGRGSLGAAFRLRKKIPVGAGLGGGSSDAAGAIRILVRLWGLRASDDRLAAVAREIGADVPFFLTGGTALGTGRGDDVRPLPFAGDWPLVLGFPPYGISTAEVYRRVSKRIRRNGHPESASGEKGAYGASRLTLPGNGVTVTRLLAHKLPGENDFGPVVNDLESVVFEGWPDLAAFREALVRAGARCALLSGSGSTVFGVFGDPEERDGAAAAVRRDFGEWTVVGVSTTPEAVRVFSATRDSR